MTPSNDRTPVGQNYDGPTTLQLPLPSTKWVWPPSCAQTLFEQYTKLRLVDHTTKHRHTTATCEAVGHDGHTNEDVQSCTLLWSAEHFQTYQWNRKHVRSRHRKGDQKHSRDRKFCVTSPSARDTKTRRHHKRKSAASRDRKACAFTTSAFFKFLRWNRLVQVQQSHAWNTRKKKACTLHFKHVIEDSRDENVCILTTSASLKHSRGKKLVCSPQAPA